MTLSREGNQESEMKHAGEEMEKEGIIAEWTRGLWQGSTLVKR